MTLYDFIALSTQKKFDALEKKGTFLKDFKANMYYLKLYSLQDFFVELYYENESQKLVKIRPFKSEKLLNKYLKDVEIKDF